LPNNSQLFATDFSPDAIQEFQNYLTEHKIFSKAKEIKKVNFSTYPWGSYPFFGWYCGSSPEEKIVIYHNGVRLAPAEMHLNRMDVYEALPPVKNPNCGFHYDIDFSAWQAGTHRIEAILELSGKKYSLDNNQLILQLEKATSTPASVAQNLPNIRSLNLFNPFSHKGYVDRGSNKAILINYNPLARQWMQFRADSIVQHQDMLGKIFTDAGIPQDIIYNYQLPPWMNGDWNNELFGVGKDFFLQSKLRAGITLYGGNTLNPELMKYLPQDKKHNIEKYGVPEFHPQIENDPEIAESSLRFHAAQGASFISPYYMNAGDDTVEGNDHKKMLIVPKNHHKGSNYLYNAIKKLLSY